MRLQGEDILCLSTISWDFLWQRHQELMSRLARDGSQVLYVEPLGIRAPGLQDLSRVGQRLWRRLLAGRRGVRRVRDGVYVHDPVIFPFHGSEVNDRLNAVLVSRVLKRIMLSLGFTKPIVWTYLPTSLAMQVIERIDHKFLVYDCVDALALNPKGVVGSYAESEQQLVQKADLVFVTSQRLYTERVHLNPDTCYVPAGVDVDHFLDVEQVPDELSEIQPPRIGFFGGIDERLDLGLLECIATSQPRWSIVMIGPVRTDVAPLRQRPNVYFLGQKRYEDLPAYLAGLDVLVIPYLVNEFTSYIYPAKLHECLATGKPTVATALPELISFQDVITVAHDQGAFVRGVARGLEEDDVSLHTRRVETARENSWEARYRRITREIQGRLTPTAN